MNKRLERKAAARQMREDHIPTPCLAGPTPFLDHVVRKLSERPIDRVARQAVRAGRRIRKAKQVLATLHPSSVFAVAVERDMMANGVIQIAARAELAKRAEKATKGAR